MANVFLAPLDLALNEIRNFVFHKLASRPGSPVVGESIYNTTNSRYEFFDGSGWQIFDPTADRARANHTGTQLAATISDFDTQVRVSRLDQMAAPTASVSLNNQKITNLLDPTAAQDSATKSYVDAARAGLDLKDSVRAATTANITLSGTQTIDGVAVIAGDRVLVKNQTTGSQNGIYVVAAGAWARSTDADANAEVTAGMATFVSEGTANGNTQWVLTTDDPITVGTTALTFTQAAGGTSYTAGTGITLTGNAIAQDTANGYGVRKFSIDVGDGAATSIVVTHNFGTRDVQVQLYRTTTPWDTVTPDFQRTTTNTVTLVFTTAPTAAQYRAVVVG